MDQQVLNRPSWDSYFMHLAEESSLRSKDLNTKVGCCLVKDNRVISLGYNGAPRSFPDEEVPWNRDTSLPLKLQKYSYIVHAELNAILNYKGDLSNLEGSTVYLTVSPCHECVKVLIQLGVKEIVYKQLYSNKDIVDMSFYLLSKCGVNIRQLKEE